MSAFELLTALFSVTVGLAILYLSRSVSDLIDIHSRVKTYWVNSVWVVTVFIWDVFSWWVM